MSPTIFRKLGSRFAFYSNEEPRMHVHVYCGSGQAKFWLEPQIELAQNRGIRSHEIKVARQLIEENIDEIKPRWKEHFRT